MVKLADISELITKGITPTTLGYEFQEDGVKFLKIECFNEQGGVIPDKVTYISEECNEKLKRSQIKENDILFSIAGAIGRVAIATREMIPANTNQALAIIRIKEGEAYIPYLKLILTSKIVRDQFEKQKQGVAQLNLSLKNIGDLEVPICSLEKQKKFVDLFSKIQGAIDKRKQELEQLDILIKARFVELFGDPSLNTKEYPVKALSEIAEYWNGLTYKLEDVSDEGTIVLRSSNIQNAQLDFADTVRVTCKIGDKKYVQDNDILMCSRNGSARLVGKVALIQNIDESMSFGAFMMIIRSNYYPYLMTYFQMPAFKAQITTGATTTINQITRRMLDDVKLPVPDMDTISEFSKFCNQVTKSKVIVATILIVN